MTSIHPTFLSSYRAYVACLLVFLIVAGCSEVTSRTSTPEARLVGPTPSTLSFSSALGTAATTRVEFGNIGDDTLVLQVGALPEWVQVSLPLSRSIDPGASVDLSFTAECTEALGIGRFEETATFTTNDPSRGSVDLPIVLLCAEPGNIAPEAWFVSSPASGTAPLEVSFDASASLDPDGDITAYEWTFGDGTQATGKVVTHVFEKTGSFAVQLVVRDDDGATGSAVEHVTVSDPSNLPPSIEITDVAPTSGTQVAPVTVTFEAAAHDADGSVTSIEWSVKKDGNTATGGNVSSDGSVFTYAFGSAGTYSVEVTATDDRLGTAKATAEYVVLSPFRVSPSALVVDGANPTTTVEVTAEGPWSLEATADWLSASPETGTAGATDVTITVDLSKLPTDTELGDRQTSSLELMAEGQKYVTLHVTVDLPDFAGATPDPLDLTARLERSSTGSLTVENAGRSSLSVRTTTTDAWLQVSPSTFSVAPRSSNAIEVTATCGSTETVRSGTITFELDDPDRSSDSVEVTVSCTPAPVSEFNIELQYFGDQMPTATQREVFEASAARWSEVVVGGLADVTIPTTIQPCPTGPTFSGTVDDLLIFASVADIDGPGNIVGQAGPCALRSSGGLPFIGIMEFDRADLDNLESRGLLDDVIMHEMGHVFGIGTLWEWGSRDLVDPACRDGSATNPRFTGLKAAEAHIDAGGQGNPHVEADGGTGTRCGHWDEERYTSELMTGFLGSGGSPLSEITIGSLEDMGYVVSYDAADAYLVPSALAMQQHEPGFQLHEVLVTPQTFD